MTTGQATLACALTMLLGVVVLVWFALPALSDGQTLVGVLVAVCAALAVVAGLAGLLVVARAARRRP